MPLRTRDKDMNWTWGPCLGARELHQNLIHPLGGERERGTDLGFRPKGTGEGRQPWDEKGRGMSLGRGMSGCAVLSQVPRSLPNPRGTRGGHGQVSR